MPSRIRLRPRGTPPTPEAGSETLFLDAADGALKNIDSSGTVTAVGGTGGGAISVDNTVDPPAPVTTLVAPGASISGDEATLPYSVITTADIDLNATGEFGSVALRATGASGGANLFAEGVSGAVLIGSYARPDGRVVLLDSNEAEVGVYVLAATDPSTGGGLAANIGSMLIVSTLGQVWMKTGTGNTDWQQLAFVP